MVISCSEAFLLQKGVNLTQLFVVINFLLQDRKSKHIFLISNS